MRSSMNKETELNTRSKSHVWLIGYQNPSLPTVNKLPSLREVLSVFFYHHVERNLTLSDSCDAVIKELLSVWEKVGIPTMKDYNIKKRLLHVHAEWQSLKKSKSRRTETQLQHEQEFTTRLDKLLDIAHQEAESLIKVPEDWQFLVGQRQARRGHIAGVDKVYEERQKKVAREHEEETRRREKSMKECEALFQRGTLDQISEESGEESSNTESGSLYKSPLSPRSSQQPSSSQIVTQHVATALDRTKVSDRNAVYLLAATAKALGQDPQELTLSRSSIRRARNEHRQSVAHAIKQNFASDSRLVVHWDGKQLPRTSGDGNADRVAVVVTGVQVEQLLGIPELTSGKGECQARAVLKCIEEWNIQENIVGMCFDTTASNTGRKVGACRIVEEGMAKSLLHLPCRHHILEVLASGAFSAMKIETSSGPDIQLFKRFREKWSWLDHSKFETAAGRQDIVPFKDRIISFSLHQLETKQPRDDYKEMLEMTIIFLGEIPPHGINFHAPGALHRARWMSKILYSFKIWMFKSQFKLTVKEEQGLFNFNMFITAVYVEAWFQATLAATAPANDLHLLQQLSTYTNAAIRQATTRSFRRHLWYLGETLVGLAFFDDQITPAEKSRMVLNLKVKPSGKNVIKAKEESDEQSSLSFFVSQTTANFFKILKLEDSFLTENPEFWRNNNVYCAAQQIIHSLKVVNDVAERGIKLIDDYNPILCRDESQKQYMLQVVQQHRRAFPDGNKATVLAGLDNA